MGLGKQLHEVQPADRDPDPKIALSRPWSDNIATDLTVSHWNRGKPARHDH
jgi:hypothetical protein